MICRCNTYGNFENPEKSLEEMKRVVKPEGEIVLSVYNTHALKMQLETYSEIGLNVLDYDDGAVYTEGGLISRRFSRSELEELGRKHGLEVEIRELTPISYVVIMRKSSGS